MQTPSVLVGEDTNVADLFPPVSLPGPPSPDVIHVQMTVGRSLEVAVYWGSVQGAESYIAWTTNGQNCTSTVQSYCFITPVECGQNHSVSVTAFNKAGPSSPSQPAEYLTCGYITHTVYLTHFKVDILGNMLISFLAESYMRTPLTCHYCKSEATASS